jgi:hypothetical protein
MAAFVSVTRLRLRKFRFLPTFIFYAFRSAKQARNTPGCLFVATIRDARLAFWTVTVWSDEKAMRSFRNSGVHLTAMPKLARWCDEATYVHWQQENSEPPRMVAAHARLVEAGTVSKVFHPSAAHASRAFPQPMRER